jgi:hypothetical protein
MPVDRLEAPDAAAVERARVWLRRLLTAGERAAGPGKEKVATGPPPAEPSANERRPKYRGPPDLGGHAAASIR